jgi:hypothetical protein
MRKMILAVALSACTVCSMAADTFHMAVVKGKDVDGHVLKKLGLPDHDYCVKQCLTEDRCTGTRWGVIEGDTAGLCVIMSGELTFRDPKDLKTQDGKRILVIASRKLPNAPKDGATL